MLRPILIIGVGGSGGKTLRSMRQTLLRQLRNRGWTGSQLPEAWQMRNFDSVTVQGTDGFGAAPMLPAGDYVGLVPPGASYQSVRRAIEERVPSQTRMAALGRWLPETSAVPVKDGAGQFRAIGRAISASSLSTIKKGLDSAVASMSTVEAQTQLRQATKLLGGDDEGPIPGPLALIISSLGGGSGSGMFMDIAEALKSYGSSFHEDTYVFMYTPDVFNTLPKGMTKSIYPNTLAALGEVAAGLWAPTRGEGTDEIFNNVGLIGKSRARFGGNALFLIGASNSVVNLGSADEIYQATGDSLANLVGNEDIQENLVKFFIINLFVNTGNEFLIEDRTKLKLASNTDHRQPFASLGFGLLSIGQDKFAEYAAEAITRSSIEDLLWPKFEPEDPDSPMTPAQLVAAREAQVWPSFLEDSGLNERNPANDVVQAFKSPERKEVFPILAAACKTAAAGGVQQQGLQPGEWQQRLLQQFNARVGGELLKEEEARQLLVRKWVGNIQDRLLDRVARSAARQGLAVTEELLKSLRDELKWVAEEELPAEAAKMRRFEATLDSEIAKALNIPMARIPANHPSVEAAANVLKVGIELKADAALLECASEVLLDLEANFISPLQDQVRRVRQALNADVDADQAPDGSENRFLLWPRLESTVVPSQYKPAPTERLLVQSEEFPGLLVELIRNSLPIEDQNSWRGRVIERALLGIDLGEKGVEQIGQLFKIGKSWVPRVAANRPSSDPAQVAEFSAPRTQQAYLREIEAWVPASESELSRFLRIDLDSYLTLPNDPAKQSERRQRFRQALAEVLSVSKPLVDVNQALLPLIHPNIKGGALVIYGTFPFPPGTEMFELCKSVMEAAGEGYWVDERTPTSFKTAQVQQIEVFTAPSTAMSPVVFDSLMRPIAESWAQASERHDPRQGWWSMRRALPLAQHLPVAPEVLQLQVKGWFLAGILGLRLQEETSSGRGPKISVWDPQENKFVEFPHPLLGIYEDSPRSIEILPAVMQSLLIALVRVNETQSLAPLVPYQVLRYLGENSYRYLRDWVSTAQLPTREIPENLKPLKDATAAERQQKMIDMLETNRQTYKSSFQSLEELNNPFAVPAYWELRHDIMTAFSALEREVQEATAEITI